MEFHNVSFAYPGAEAPVLDGVSFTAAPGTVTAVIGATGSGKTTLLNLLPRFLDATGGQDQHRRIAMSAALPLDDAARA